MVIGSTVTNDSTNEWLALDQKVNSYPTVRGFTAIGTGGDDFMQAMVVAVESVIKETIPQAVEFGQKLARKLFFQTVLDDNLFEDGNHLYRFLDGDPIVASQCHNIPRGIITVKPKPITEIASRLRLLSYTMFEAYASEDGRHLDYRSMHGSEEFARYLRIVEELQRVEILDLSREETLAFFINLYNMMTIHAILVWGQPAGALERRKLFGDFKYVIGGST